VAGDASACGSAEERAVNKGLHHVRLHPGQRVAVYGLVGVLWLTGAAWLVLHHYFAQLGPLGRAPHPLEPALLLMHGVISILGMYLFGWITARHVLRWWPGRVRRWSGGGLAALLALLAVSGFALFFLSNDDWQRYSSLTHEVLGVLVFAVPHWCFARDAR